MKNNRISLMIISSFAVFAIFVVYIISTILIGIVLTYIGAFNQQNQIGLLALIVMFSLPCIMMGFIFSYIIKRIVFIPIIKISQATQEVSHGNFDIRVEENIMVKEIHDMAQNFNTMTSQLAGMEILRNDFISNVSHEFKTPLAAIEGYTTLLQTKDLSEERKQFYTSKIIYNTKRLSELTGNILQLTRLENQNIDITKNVFSLDEQIRQVILLYEEQWINKNIDLHIHLDEINYNGNEELLSQVWQNLIGNALKFTDNDGMIWINMRQELDSIKIEIADDGIGMNEETMNRIFEKFYQGDTSHSRNGNGLGLALVKKILDLHQGSIEVSSKINEGSTFIIKLPIS
ncbi:MAG: HAMP domain-containing histidine kinase [Erysipelotrichaceae bacterium]|nr:HAMP domain-containing histidine kinase [Erysipelotrichaceae bacterium]